VSNEKRDRELGMDRAIPRRDFLNGMSLVIGGSLVGANDFLSSMLATADKQYAPEKEPGYYPPSKTGMRGSHDGSWEVAHAMRDGKAWSRNWKAFEKLKVHSVSCPGSFFSGVEMDFPVSMGGYEFTQKPDEPCVLHLHFAPLGEGATARDKQRSGRAKLMTMQFALFERNIRDQLGRVLDEGGFDPASDIEAITVNRWPHGYAYEYNSLYDPVWPPGQAPNEIGRQPFGRIHIANSDAGAFAYTNEAIDQGYRAVQEIVARKA